MKARLDKWVLHLMLYSMLICGTQGTQSVQQQRALLWTRSNTGKHKHACSLMADSKDGV